MLLKKSYLLVSLITSTILTNSFATIYSDGNLTIDDSVTSYNFGKSDFNFEYNNFNTNDINITTLKLDFNPSYGDKNLTLDLNLSISNISNTNTNYIKFVRVCNEVNCNSNQSLSTSAKSIVNFDKNISFNHLDLNITDVNHTYYLVLEMNTTSIQSATDDFSFKINIPKGGVETNSSDFNNSSEFNSSIISVNIPKIYGTIYLPNNINHSEANITLQLFDNNDTSFATVLKEINATATNDLNNSFNFNFAPLNYENYYIRVPDQTSKGLHDLNESGVFFGAKNLSNASILVTGNTLTNGTNQILYSTDNINYNFPTYGSSSMYSGCTKIYDNTKTSIELSSSTEDKNISFYLYKRKDFNIRINIDNSNLSTSLKNTSNVTPYLKSEYSFIYDSKTHYYTSNYALDNSKTLSNLTNGVLEVNGSYPDDGTLYYLYMQLNRDGNFYPEPNYGGYINIDNNLIDGVNNEANITLLQVDFNITNVGKYGSVSFNEKVRENQSYFYNSYAESNTSDFNLSTVIIKSDNIYIPATFYDYSQTCSDGIIRNYYKYLYYDGIAWHGTFSSTYFNLTSNREFIMPNLTSSKLSISPSTLNFDGSGSNSFTITNSDEAPWRAKVYLRSGDTTIFSVTPTYCDLMAKASCQVTVNYTPFSDGSHSATLTVEDGFYPAISMILSGQNTTISNSTTNSTSTISTESGTTISIAEGISVETNESGVQTIQTEAIKLDSITSQSTTQINTDGTVNTNITITDKIGEKISTIINAPTKVNVQINSDGSIENSLKLENTISDIVDEKPIEKQVEVNISVKAENTGEVKAKFDIANKADSSDKLSREFQVSKGARVDIKEDGSIVSVNKFIKNTNSNEINSQVEAKPDGSLKATLIEYENDKLRGTKKPIVKAMFSAKSQFDDVKVEVFIDEVSSFDTRGITKIDNGTIKATYTSSKEFSYESTLKRELINTTYNISSVSIIPKSLWQRYEELHKLDGTRVIKLMSGHANIIIDGKEQEMEIGKEYPLPPLEMNENTDTNEDVTQKEDSNETKEGIFKNGELKISKGWNLLSIPVDVKDINITKFEYEKFWIFQNKHWILVIFYYELPTSIGFWLKSENEQIIKFEGKEYQPNFKNLQEGWNLVGTGVDIENVNEKYNFKSTWSYYNGTWSENPKIIYRGQGFWVSK